MNYLLFSESPLPACIRLSSSSASTVGWSSQQSTCSSCKILLHPLNPYCIFLFLYAIPTVSLKNIHELFLFCACVCRVLLQYYIMFLLALSQSKRTFLLQLHYSHLHSLRYFLYNFIYICIFLYYSNIIWLNKLSLLRLKHDVSTINMHSNEEKLI